MKPLVTKGLTAGLSMLIDYLTTEKPLRTWLRKRRAAKNAEAVPLAAELDQAADKALAEAAKKLGKN